MESYLAGVPSLSARLLELSKADALTARQASRIDDEIARLKAIIRQRREAWQQATGETLLVEPPYGFYE